MLLGIIEGVIKFYGHESATYLSALSHREPGWILAQDHEEIPYETILISREPPPEFVFDEFRELHFRLGLSSI
jgi:hypothetical protein